MLAFIALGKDFFHLKMSDISLYFAQKHRIWASVGTAVMRLLRQSKKNYVYHAKPQFSLYIGVFQSVHYTDLLK